MPITAQFLKGVMTEARPIIERQMDDAKLIAGFRTVVANNGGDWGALKALIKAHIEDENDETGDGTRVQKILEKADSSTAYADMLGLVNMNEKNFSEEQFPPAAPSRTTPASLPESDGEEISGETQGSEALQGYSTSLAARGADESAVSLSENGLAGPACAHDDEAANIKPAQDFQPPAFLTRAKTMADYRPHCQRPDACGSSSLKHCYSCAKAIGDVEVA